VGASISVTAVLLQQFTWPGVVLVELLAGSSHIFRPVDVGARATNRPASLPGEDGADRGRHPHLAHDADPHTQAGWVRGIVWPVGAVAYIGVAVGARPT
jgi:hypothetical protein